MKNILPLLLLSAVLLFNACKKDEDTGPGAADFDAQVANDFMALSIKLTKETAGFTPPVAARTYGYLGLTLYEAVVPGMPDYNSLQGSLNGLPAGTLTQAESKEYHWGAVAANALATGMKNFYKTASAANLQAIEDLRLQYEQQFLAETSAEVYARSEAYGFAMGAAVYAFAATDGQEVAYTTNFPTSYTPPVHPGAWVPTPPAFQRALQPYWGNVRTFLGSNVDGTQPPSHPVFSTFLTSQFYAQALEVYTITSSLTTEQATIAEFWSDDPGLTGTPPGHSMNIALQILEKENASLELAAEVFAKVGFAVHDAFVSCWKCKYDFSLMRPVTYIIDYIDPNYTTLLTTPPFPEFTSGHSVQTGATMRILSDIFGYNYAFTDKTHEARTDINGAPRSYDSFYKAANEAAISRLYGGIHYRFGIELGVDQGIRVGINVGKLPFKK